MKLDCPHKAVFFDRDGVIVNAIIRSGRPFPPDSLDCLEINPEAHAALKSLSVSGYLLVIVTNQPDVARGKQTREVVESMHNFLMKELPLEKIMVCYHDDEDQCGCRKPAPGLLLEAADIYRIDLEKSYIIGDRWRDIEAGQRARCQTIFIDYDYLETKPDNPTFVVRSLSEAVKIILNKEAVRSI